ncbi:hypothetical protein BDV93DRAFT_512112 [Ceratobasidium sp. AG-I]|nr:hypothetical protein BDV93DRAFT_512112 [Ceratobasidium sp. AG-I]
MLKSRKRPFDSIFWDNTPLSAFERIHLLDVFTMDQESQLDAAADAMASFTVDSSYWNYSTAMVKETPSTIVPTPAGAAATTPFSRPAIDGQRAAKRQATGWQAGDGASTRIDLDQNPQLSHMVPYLDSVSINQSQSYRNEFSLHEQPAPAAATALLESQALDNSTLDPGFEPEQPAMVAPPQPGRRRHVVNTYSQDSTGTSAASPLTSSDINSFHHTIFTQPHPSSQSHTNRFAFVNTPLQAGPTAISTFPASAIAYLNSDPMVISQAARNEAALGENRRGKPWGNWEINIVLRFRLGPDVPDDNVLAAMKSPMTPRPDDNLGPDWNYLSEVQFAGKRSANTIVRKWWTLLDMFCVMIASFSSAQHDSTSTILNQIMHVINGQTFSPIGELRTEDLVSWAVGGHDGWFGIVYNKIRNHGFVVDRVSRLRLSGQPSSVRSISQPRRRSSRSGSSIGHSSHGMAPPRLTPMPGLGQQFSQMSQSSLGDAQPPLVGAQVPPVPPNVPATIEMVRNHGAVTKARVQMALAKATYIFAFADTERAKLYQRFAAVELSYRGDARQAAKEALDHPNCTAKMRDSAEVLFVEQMNNHLPRVDIPKILAQLQQGLPSLDELGLLPPGTPSTPEMPHLPHLGPEGATADDPVDDIPPLEHFWPGPGLEANLIKNHSFYWPIIKCAA